MDDGLFLHKHNVHAGMATSLDCLYIFPRPLSLPHTNDLGCNPACNLAKNGSVWERILLMPQMALSKCDIFRVPNVGTIKIV
eukprot:13967186-Ditylum_brightwellii.AAC.1